MQPAEQCGFTEVWTQDRQLTAPQWHAQVSVNCSLGPAEAPAEAAPGCSSGLKRRVLRKCVS